MKQRFFDIHGDVMCLAYDGILMWDPYESPEPDLIEYPPGVQKNNVFKLEAMDSGGLVLICTGVRTPLWVMLEYRDPHGREWRSINWKRSI